MLVLFVSSLSFFLYPLCHRPLLFLVAINFITDRSTFSTLSLKHSLTYKSQIYPASTTTTYHLADSSSQVIFAAILWQKLKVDERSHLSLRNSDLSLRKLLSSSMLHPWLHFPLFAWIIVLCYTSVTVLSFSLNQSRESNNKYCDTSSLSSTIFTTPDLVKAVNDKAMRF